ncbi:MAG: hypothetical protein K6E30_06295 [Lachnospiraceae bacterium]|nr:hypothetical protein [Lachnospiraceae bacterium]
MGDVYEELLVKRKTTAVESAMKGIAYGLTVLLFAAAILFFGFPALILGSLMLLVDYFLVPKLDVEYEYQYANGEIDIDAIYSKQRRKRLASISLVDMECIAPLGSHYLDGYQNGYSVLDYSARDPETRPFVFVRPSDRKLIYMQLEEDDMKKDIKTRKMRAFHED